MIWQGTHAEFMDALYRLLNTYARRYTVVNPLGDSGYAISAAQAHVISLAVQSPDLNMAQMGAKLGVTPASFSNTATKLEAFGYVRREHRAGNRKEVFLVPTDAGRRLHRAYRERVTATPFARVFELADSIPHEHRGTFIEILEELTSAYLSEGSSRLPETPETSNK